MLAAGLAKAPSGSNLLEDPEVAKSMDKAKAELHGGSDAGAASPVNDAPVDPNDIEMAVSKTESNGESAKSHKAKAEDADSDSESDEEDLTVQKKLTRMLTRKVDDVRPEHKSLAVMNVAGDLIHNFIDGALLGATFSINTTTGWTTTLAIVLHELPQELGEFAILMQSGMPTWRALLTNFLVSLSAFVGCIIAVPLGIQFSMAITKALPFAGGLFLYLALAGIVPQLMDTRDLCHGIAVCTMFCVGLGLMALMLLMPHTHAE